MNALIRLFYRIAAHVYWFDLDRLRDERRDCALMIVALERELQKPLRARRRADLEFDLVGQRSRLVGIDEAIRLTNRDATRAAMRAQI